MRRFMLAGVLMITVCCASSFAGQTVHYYEGPRQSPDRVSTLHVRDAYTLHQFDGKAIPTSWNRPSSKWRGPDIEFINVLPGRHTLSVRRLSATRSGNAITTYEWNDIKVISLEAEAGKTYLLQGWPPNLRLLPKKK